MAEILFARYSKWDMFLITCIDPAKAAFTGPLDWETMSRIT
jgi:hypothetical protein